MIIRVFRARAKPGAADELARLIEDVSIPFVDRQPGLLSRFTGRGLGTTADEFVMVTIWESLEALKGMTGDEWERAVIPDSREAEIIAETYLHHFTSSG